MFSAPTPTLGVATATARGSWKSWPHSPEGHSQHHPDTEQLCPLLALFMPQTSLAPFISLPRNQFCGSITPSQGRLASSDQAVEGLPPCSLLEPCVSWNRSSLGTGRGSKEAFSTLCLPTPRLLPFFQIPPGHGRRRSPAADVMYLSDSFLLRTEPCILAFLPQLCAQ